MLVSLVVIVATVYLFGAIPKGFFPSQDTSQAFAVTEASQDISFEAMEWLHRTEFRNATSPFEKNTFIRSEAVTGFVAANSHERFVWSPTGVRLLLLARENARPNEQAPRF